MSKKLFKEEFTNEQSKKIIEMNKTCKAQALLIVEQLLETNVDPDWLLRNLRYLNKSYMEDVVEERTLIKLCGYALCSKSLNVLQQKYHISTRSNKVYDINKRKKFCSLSCYRAYNYLFEQILDSPLWFRTDVDIPVFKILSTNSKPAQCVVTNKIIDNDCVQSITDNTNDKKKYSEYNIIERTKDVSCDTLDFKEKNTHNLLNNINIEKDIQKISLNTDSQKIFNCETNLSKPYKNSRNKDYNTQESMKDHHDNTEKINIKSENLEVESIRQCKHILHKHNIKHNIEQTSRFQSNADSKNDEIRTLQTQSDEIHSNSAVMPSNPHVKCEEKKDVNKINKTKLIKQKESNNVKTPDDVYYDLVKHVEQNVREWITKDTLCVLFDKEDKKDRLLEKFIQQEKHEKTCKKLNKVQLENKLRNCAKQEKNILKPVPDFSVLQEEGKQLELKVCAFYKGQMAYSSSEDSNKKAEKADKDDDNKSVLPLMEKYMPNLARQKVFLDKLNTVLPNLLHFLIQNRIILVMMERTYKTIKYDEKYSLVKFLISTFNLSAKNISFLTAEWKLVGLIIIKMLSLIEAELQSLLQSKPVSIYVSMILKLYKLDSNYLDRFIISITNDVDHSVE